TVTVHGPGGDKRLDEAVSTTRGVPPPARRRRRPAMPTTSTRPTVADTSVDGSGTAAGSVPKISNGRSCATPPLLIGLKAAPVDWRASAPGLPCWPTRVTGGVKTKPGTETPS